MRTLRITSLATTLLLVAAAVQADTASKTVLGNNEYLAAGSRALMLGEYEEGVRLSLLGLRAETRRIHRARALSNLCAGYAGAREYPHALEACNAAIELNSGNWRAYNNRSLALIGLGRFADARRDLEKALSIRPESPKLAQTSAWIEAHAPRMVIAKAEVTE